MGRRVWTPLPTLTLTLLLGVAAWSGAQPLAVAETPAWPPAASTAPSAPRTPPLDARLPFSIERPPGGRPILALGVNRFTPEQYARFLAGLDEFLARAAARPADQQVVWRIDGLRGYLSVSTSPFPGGPRFLLTLRGEPVRSFDSEASLLNALTLVGYRVLEAGRDAPPRPDGGPFPQFVIP